MDLFYLLILIFIVQIDANIGSWINLGMQGVGIMNNEIDSLGGSASADMGLFQIPQFNSLDQSNQLLLNNMHTPNGQQHLTNNLQQQNQHKMMLKQQIQKLSCDQLDGLSKGQKQICHLNKDHLFFIGKAARMGISECQHQFQKSRWNCSTYDDSSVFGPIVDTGSKEVAFTHAISSAAVVHSLARACRDGALSNCGCSRAKRPDSLKVQWKWTGCGDNVEYSYRFGKPFVDVREEEQSFNKLSKKQGRKLMNLHNNEAGRFAVLKKTRVSCKCHGVSGSCSIVTCWQQLSSFREVGDFLKDRHDAATEVRLNKRGKLQVVNKKFAKPTKLDLVYIEDSPDFCSAVNPLTTNVAPEVEQLPVSNRLVAKRQSIAKASKHLSKKGRKYRSNKATRQSRQANSKLARTAIRTAQRRVLDHRLPRAQRLIAEIDKHDSNSTHKLDNPNEEDNQTFKEDDLNQFDGGQSSIIPQLTDEQQQELTDEQKEQYTQLIAKQEEKEVQPIKQMVLLGTQGRECNRTSLDTDNCNILCCGRGYHTVRVLVKEKCNCRFVWCCNIVCSECKYYTTKFICR